MHSPEIIKRALIEDCALRDITSNLTIKKNSLSSFEIRARQDLIFCGKKIISQTFLLLKESQKFKKSKIDLEILISDGEAIKAGKSIAHGHGDTKLILAAERVILNFIQHLSGIATITAQFVKKLDDKNITILDTRKTIPNLRNLQKQAIIAGGGNNHRFNLSDMILIKDNHIASAGSVSNALALAKKTKRKIEIECDNFSQVVEALPHCPNIIMLDNMEISQIKKCADEIRKKSPNTKIEISGGITLENINNYKNLDIDFISVGALTHSVKAVDIALDIS